MFITNLIKVGGCAMMFFYVQLTPSGVDQYLTVLNRVRRRRARRGRILACQVRHPDRAAAAQPAGRRERLDRRAHGRFDHPRHPAGRGARERNGVAPAACVRPAALRNLHRHPGGGRDCRDRVRLSRGSGVQSLHPRHGVDHHVPKKNPFYLIRDFAHCNNLLWKDKLGQISLATTTLFWGAGATLQFIVLEWARAALGYPLSKATALQGITAVASRWGRWPRRVSSRCVRR